MTHEELEKSFEYRMTKEALKYWNEHKNVKAYDDHSEICDAFEDGAQWAATNLPDEIIINVLKALQDCSLLTDEQRNIINYLPYGYMIDQTVQEIKNHISEHGKKR